MYACKISKECYKIVVNIFCTKRNAYDGVIVGYGNKDYILNKFDKILGNTITSSPYIEEYNCVSDICKCNIIYHYKD